MKESVSPILHFPILSRADFIFFRLLGSGLGNLLFPIYRAYQAQQEMGGELVFPQVMQLKPGPMLRGEPDARAYGDIFQFRNIEEVLLHAKVLSYMALGKLQHLRLQEGLGRHFHDLDPQYRTGFKTWLSKRYRRPQALEATLAKVQPVDICVHIRRGDFGHAGSPMADHGTMNFSIEDAWYIQATELARQNSPRAQVRVFTDAPRLPDDLLKALDPIEIDQSPNAFHALMKMAAHGTIVASRSSFSLWAAYLGSGHAIISRDFDLDRYMPARTLSTLNC